MLTAISDITSLRPHFRSHNRELLGVLLNARSVAEANLALDALKDEVATKTLVKACNMREVLQGIPQTPFVMSVDERTLERANGLERHMAALSKKLGDRTELTITTAGNLVLDVIVRDPQGVPHYWTPIPATDDFVDAVVLDLLVNSPYLLAEVIELVRSMGVVFNPKFYLSLEDFYLEYASDAFDAIEDMFWR